MVWAVAAVGDGLKGSVGFALLTWSIRTISAKSSVIGNEHKASSENTSPFDVKSNFLEIVYL